MQAFCQSWIHRYFYLYLYFYFYFYLLDIKLLHIKGWGNKESRLALSRVKRDYSD